MGKFASNSGKIDCISIEFSLNGGGGGGDGGDAAFR